MNKELLDWVNDAYQNYLINFVKPICPPECYCHPDFYLPFEKEKFLTIILDNKYRNKEFAEKWGVTVTHTELTTNERMDYWFKNNKPNRDVCDDVDELPPNEKDVYFNYANVPKQLIKLTYNNTSIEIYE